MKINRYTGQIVGPFLKNEELFDKIQSDASVDIKYISHIGIQTDRFMKIKINNKEYEIGSTGIYEIGNTEINSIIFLQDVDSNSIIDYVIK